MLIDGMEDTISSVRRSLFSGNNNNGQTSQEVVL
jgi:hypothetical protein